MTHHLRPRPPIVRALSALLILLLVSTGAAFASSEDATFTAALDHYEEIRVTLLDDSTDGVGEHAEALAESFEALERNWTPEAAALAAVAPEDAADAKALLPELAEAARVLAATDDLEGARDAFYELSKPLIRYLQTASGDDLPEVAYCPMKKRSWVQPEGPIGNPYGGQDMPTCGVEVGS